MPKSWWHTHAVGKSQVLCPKAGRMPLRLAKVVAVFQDNIGKSTNGSFQETRKTEKYIIAPNFQHKSG